MKALNSKLEQANTGLAAAARLSEQLDKKSQVIATLKQEIKLREELLKKAQSELDSASSHNAGKVDKSLVKNLVVGYVTADAGKKPDVLRVVATVLDFNGEERQKTGLDGGAANATWLRGIFGPGGAGGQAKVAGATGLDQSLAQAFVQFLETESTPKVPLKLPAAEMAASRMAGPSRRSSTNTPEVADLTAGRPSSVSASPSPALMTPPPPSALTPSSTAMAGRSSPNPLLAMPTAHALPTFSVNRSSSAILKHVLQEEKK